MKDTVRLQKQSCMWRHRGFRPVFDTAFRSVPESGAAPNCRAQNGEQPFPIWGLLSLSVSWQTSWFNLLCWLAGKNLWDGLGGSSHTSTGKKRMSVNGNRVSGARLVAEGVGETLTPWNNVINQSGHVSDDVRADILTASVSFNSPPVNIRLI